MDVNRQGNRCEPGAGAWRQSACAIALTASLCATAVSRSDEIELGGTRLERIRIVDVEGGQIAYRTPAGKFHYAPLAEVVRIQVDTVGTMGDLNEAESRKAKGDYVRAIPHYERALRVASEFWVRLVRARLIQAADEADRIDVVATQFILLLRDEAAGPALAAELLPQNAPSSDSRGVPRALRTIDEVIERAPSQSARVLLDMLKFHVAQAAGQEQTAELADAVTRQPIPPIIATRSVYRVKRRAWEALLVRGRTEEVLAAVNAELAAAPLNVLPEALLVKAQALLKTATDDEACLRAGWAAMRIVIHYPQDALTPDALLLASRVYERIGRAPTALQLIQECLDHERTTVAVRRGATAAVERLRSAG